MTATSFKCPRRAESHIGSSPALARDNDYSADGDACYYCGSLNPDTFMARLEAGDILLGSTDKNYKVYVSGRGLHSCKFYFQHLGDAQRQRFIELYNERRVRFQGEGLYVLPFFCKKVESNA